MPGKAAKLLDMLGVQDDKRTGKFANYGRDFDYGTAKIDLGTCAFDSLFPPLPVDDPKPPRS